MKLNVDCVRSVLLKIETEQVYVEGAGRSLKRLSGEELTKTDLIDRYSADDIFYTVKQLYDGDFIEATPIKALRFSDYIIQDITPQGHEFLENIRDNSNWNKTKSIAQKAGSFCLSLLKDVAAQVIAETAKSSLGLS